VVTHTAHNPIRQQWTPASAGVHLSGASVPWRSCDYLAGRKATWIWIATPGGADIPRISLVL
jgi:hypothetical protein